jgi:hypothetical protein
MVRRITGPELARTDTRGSGTRDFTKNLRKFQGQEMRVITPHQGKNTTKIAL